VEEGRLNGRGGLKAHCGGCIGGREGGVVEGDSDFRF